MKIGKVSVMDFVALLLWIAFIVSMGELLYDCAKGNYETSLARDPVYTQFFPACWLELTGRITYAIPLIVIFGLLILFAILFASFMRSLLDD